MTFMEILRHVRTTLIWGTWSVAWALMLVGTLNDVRFLAWGVFVGTGAAVIVIWDIMEAVARRERLGAEELASGFAHAIQRRDGPRGL